MFGHATPPFGTTGIILWALCREYYKARDKASENFQASKNALRRFVGTA